MENNNGLSKKYGLLTAIAMVVGIVIGSGVFFKAQVVLQKTSGDMPLGILAWAIGGAIMIICANTFAFMATKYEKVNGVVDYAEATMGKKYAYFVGWFMTTIYYPTLTSVLAWLSARYTMELFGSADVAGGTCLALSGLFLILSYAVNALSPIIAGRFQVATTIIKLIPLFAMAIVGTVAGLINGNVNSSIATAGSGNMSSLFAAVVATAFAYEGWIIATAINAELKNAKRNLPLALTIGAIIVVTVYIIYYIGLAGGASIDILQEHGASKAFLNVFGNIGGTILKVFIVISCLGTLNGLMLGCVRGMYSLSVRNSGPLPKVFGEIDKNTNMPVNSSIIGLVFAALWLFYFFGANLRDNLFGLFGFDSSEIPIVTLYALYIPMFIMFIKKTKDGGVWKSKVLPILSIIASVFMIFACIYAHGYEPYINAKNGSDITEYTAYVGIKDGVPTIGEGEQSISAETGVFTINGTEYIVDEEGVRITLNSETETMQFTNTEGALDITPKEVKSNSVLVNYDKTGLTTVTYNDNITFKAKGDVKVTASYSKPSSKFTCPVLFYLIVFAVVMGVGALFAPKNEKKTAAATTAAEE